MATRDPWMPRVTFRVDRERRKWVVECSECGEISTTIPQSIAEELVQEHREAHRRLAREQVGGKS